MKVLVACEYSGRVRDAFINARLVRPHTSVVQMVKLDTALNEFWTLLAETYLNRFRQTGSYWELTQYVNAREHIN
jgi:hypothetical protein